MSEEILPRILLQLNFRAKQRIKDLPYYKGALWNALFRELVREYAGVKQALAAIGFCVHPIESGRIVYSENEAVNLGISFPSEYVEPVVSMLQAFNTISINAGKLNPSSLLLEKVICRMSGQVLNIAIDKNENINSATNGASHYTQIIPYTSEQIEKDAIELMQSEKFQMIFYAPLRLKSTVHYKIDTGNRYIGANFFSSEKYNPLAHLFANIGIFSTLACYSGISIQQQLQQRCLCSNPDESNIPDVKEFNISKHICISSSSMIWHDCKYGYDTTTIGGLIGRIEITGRLTWEQATRIVQHQYIGIGKNRTFGFGFYHIPEIRKNRQVEPLSRGITLFDKAFCFLSLQNALENLPNSSPGSDGLIPEDLKKVGEPFLLSLEQSISGKTYRQGNIIKYRKDKKSGGYRIINVFNASDRVVHRAVADVVMPVTEKLLSESAFAYRRGLNRQGAAKAIINAFKDGYTHGVKADITAFFESVNTQYLYEILLTLFPFDPLPEFILYLLEDAQKQDIKGLPQGSPLSPVLSNLYLDKFDKEMEKLNFRLIRYGDDFVALFKPDTTEEFCLDKIASALKNLGLTLNQNKTVKIEKNTPFNFLGYEITSSSYESEHKEETEKNEEQWLPVFKEDWVRGHPVYLTSICRGAYSSGPHIVINSDTDSSKAGEKDETATEEIPWNRISRIVVVGRAGFSSGIAYRAIKEDIPVTFIDIMGRESGNLVSTIASSNSVYNINIQQSLVDNPQFCLEFAREIISAKIQNSHVLMRRNGVNDQQMKIMAEKALEADSVEQLRGFEGNAARIYFQAFRAFAEPFEFEKRVFHPPDNPVNAMLSFGYTLIYNRIATAIRAKGLNPYNGFFHRTHGRHCALASDLMEELRHVIDRIVLTLIHLKEVKPENFTVVDNDGEKFCRMDGEAFRKFIRKYETVMATYFKYSGEERINYNAYLDDMVNKLVRAMKLSVPYTALRIR